MLCVSYPTPCRQVAKVLDIALLYGHRLARSEVVQYCLFHNYAKHLACRQLGCWTFSHFAAITLQVSSTDVRYYLFYIQHLEGMQLRRKMFSFLAAITLQDR